MKSNLTRLSAISSTLLFSSCSSDIIFATHTSTGLDVSGDIAKVPDHISLGFRRRELVYVGKEVPKSASVLGKLDSQTNWNGGIAIRETFATGPVAASIAAGEIPRPENEAAVTDETTDSSQSPVVLPTIINHPVVFASRSRFGFGFSIGGSDDDAIPTLQVGYSRRVATHMHVDPATTKNGQIPSVLADTSVHGSGILGANTAPKTEGVDPKARISLGDNNENTQGGIRIRQLFAIGKGATSLIKSEREAKNIKTAIAEQQPLTASEP